MRAARCLALALLLAGCSTRLPESSGLTLTGDTLGVQPFGPRFEDARALAADPSGRLYVVDAGAAAVQTLAPDGRLLATLGGPGTGDYAFLDPADVDPTNGLVLAVADAGNGRIQRFSFDGQLVETLRVAPDLDETDGPRSSRFGAPDDGGDTSETGAGRPVAVASAVTGELFAVEELRGVVLRWNDRERSVRVVGGIEAGAGALRGPVGLALGPDGRLFVADRGHAAVLVYDAFGSYLRRIASGVARDIRAVGVIGERLVLVLPRQALVYGLDGRQRRVLAFDLAEPLVDAAGAEDGLVLLTSTRLYRAALP
ncbi:MAG: NHL repeat-containing protein [Bacteroidota bacterium]